MKRTILILALIAAASAAVFAYNDNPLRVSDSEYIALMDIARANNLSERTFTRSGVIRRYGNHVEGLNLERMNITRLPRSISRLTYLERLDVSDNRISELPTEIGRLTRLEYLDVYYNRLRHLPGAVRNLRYLRTLLAEHNDLIDLPYSFDDLRNLTTLNLRNNNITSLPSGFDRLSSLRDLDVRGNRFYKDPWPVFDRMRNLRDVKCDFRRPPKKDDRRPGTAPPPKRDPYGRPLPPRR